MIRINLLPVRVSKKKEAGKNQLIFFALAVMFALICNFWWARSRADELAARTAKVNRTRDEIAQLEKIIGEVKNIKAQQSAVKDKLAVLEKLKAGRQGPVRVLDELATLIPKRVWLRRMDEKQGAVTFDGSAGTIDDVSGFLSALKKAQYFSAPELKKTSAKTEGKLKLVEFTITATVNYTPNLQIAAAVAGAQDGKAR
jgi:type IV pilus assembly protein PilN